MPEEMEQLSFKISKTLKAELMRLAEQDRRKLSPYVALVLERHALETKGKLKRK